MVKYWLMWGFRYVRNYKNSEEAQARTYTHARVRTDTCAIIVKGLSIVKE